MTKRTIILHNHLFKNAGTSIDAILKANFGDYWVSREFPMMNGNNTIDVEKWILETPEAIAFSSHTIMGPLPVIEGVEVISLVLLRDPIERVKSAYRFERKQKANTWGAKLAKIHDFDGYLRARLARENDRQCKNFQTYRLSSLINSRLPELARAKAALHEISLVGRVEMLQDFLNNLERELSKRFMGFTVGSFWENKSSADCVDVKVPQVLLESNWDDLELLKYFDKLHRVSLP